MISLFIPITPKAFERPRFKGKRGFNSPEYAAYKEALQWHMRTFLRGSNFVNQVGRAVDLALVFHFPKPKKPKYQFPSTVDLDNLIKAVADAGNGLLWHDDRQIVRVEARKFFSDLEGIQIAFQHLSVMEWLREPGSNRRPHG